MAVRGLMDAQQQVATRALYLRWSATTNPILLVAAAELRQAAGFVMTDAEREQILHSHRVMPPA